MSKGLVLILSAFSSCLKLRAHRGQPAPYEPALPVPLISLLAANLHACIQKAVVLVKVLLRQVRVIFQTRCRFVWELDRSLSGLCWGRWGMVRSALPCPARPLPQRSLGTARPGCPNLSTHSLAPTNPQLHHTPNPHCKHSMFSCTVSPQTLSAF